MIYWSSFQWSLLDDLFISIASFHGRLVGSYYRIASYCRMPFVATYSMVGWFHIDGFYAHIALCLIAGWFYIAMPHSTYSMPYALLLVGFILPPLPYCHVMLLMVYAHTGGLCAGVCPYDAVVAALWFHSLMGAYVWVMSVIPSWSHLCALYSIDEKISNLRISTASGN